jgi:hypothetical protein
VSFTVSFDYEIHYSYFLFFQQAVINYKMFNLDNVDNLLYYLMYRYLHFCLRDLQRLAFLSQLSLNAFESFLQIRLCVYFKDVERVTHKIFSIMYWFSVTYIVQSPYFFLFWHIAKFVVNSWRLCIFVLYRDLLD